MYTSDSIDFSQLFHIGQNTGSELIIQIQKHEVINIQ